MLFSNDVYGKLTLEELQLLTNEHDLAQLKEDGLCVEWPFVSNDRKNLVMWSGTADVIEIDALSIKTYITCKSNPDNFEKDSEGKAVESLESKSSAYNIGKSIKSVRKHKKISQKKLSAIIEMDQSVISRIETGKQLPQLDTLIRIANGLKVSVSVFFFTDKTLKNK